MDQATAANSIADVSQKALTFASPAFVLAVLAMALAAFIAVLVYKAAARPGGGEILSKFATPEFVMTMLFLGVIVMAMWIAFYGPLPISQDLQAAILGAVIISGLPELRKRWLDVTADSAKKNDTIQTLAKTIERAGTGPGTPPATTGSGGTP